MSGRPSERDQAETEEQGEDLSAASRSLLRIHDTVRRLTSAGGGDVGCSCSTRSQAISQAGNGAAFRLTRRSHQTPVS